MRALRGPFAALVVLTALIVVAVITRPAAARDRGARASTLPVTSNSLVCPNISGSLRAPSAVTIANVSGSLPGGTSSRAALHTIPLAGAHATSTVRPSRALERIEVKAVARPTTVSATGRGAGAIVADQSRLIPHGTLRGLFSSPCQAPATDWWITGADGRVGYNDTLVLANPGSTVVNLTVSAWSAKGPQQPPTLQSFTVNPRSAQLLTVSRYVPDAAFVTLHVRANSGRVVAALLDRRVAGVLPVGLDWIPPTQAPSTDLVVPGYLSGAGSRHLVLADPGSRDATVTLRLVTTSGNFAPAGHQTVVVRAGHGADVDLTSSLAGAPGAVVIHSDQPVTAAGLSSAGAANSQDRPDTQWQPAAAPITGPAAIADNTPPFDRNVRVYITSPDRAARLRVATSTGASKVVSIPAGRTVGWDPVAAFGADAHGSLVFTPVSGGPTYVSRTLYAYGAHGPLATAEQPTVLPVAVTLPGAFADQRAAVPGGR